MERSKGEGDSTYRLLRAARRQAADRTPVWFMRQAGRFLPAYRELRRKHSIQDLCRIPELAVQASMTAVEALPGLDGAIIFSDILQIPQAMGIEVRFVASEGPAIGSPLTTEADVEALKSLEPERDLRGPIEGIRMLRREVEGKMPVIGFAGAPFTLASYLIEGGPSKDFLKTKRLMCSVPGFWAKLMAKLADAVADHLNAQIRAGAHIVQLFDSWVGALGVDDYGDYVQPYVRSILKRVQGAPVIHFGTGTAALLERMRDAGGDVIGLDWRVDLAEAWKRLGPGVGVQGNLDPAALLAPRPELERRVDAILDRAGGRPGHIFNLGHGVLPETPVENVIAVIERVHKPVQSPKSAGEKR
ncbi:MAG: uroporphyrinogen decarboxylase [Planctomycetes bacterium]|nr:uroporphyrinogen decarboxylase [Planctomycetota bacterium]